MSDLAPIDRSLKLLTRSRLTPDSQWNQFLDLACAGVAGTWGEFNNDRNRSVPSNGEIRAAVVKYCNGLKKKAGSAGNLTAFDGGPRAVAWRSKKHRQVSIVWPRLYPV